MNYEISLYQNFFPSSPVTTAISASLTLPILLYTFSGNVGGVLFGIGFWSVSRAVNQHSHVRDYMFITAYGFILYFTAGGATVLQAGYPPFGLANVSFVGLASFLILTGLYQSAISVAQDIKLRQSIKTSTVQQSSKLLDSIGTAQMTKEIEEKVMKMTQDNAARLMQESGVESSLTDNEMKSYLEQVLYEIKKDRQEVR
jgi:hypothetical protein